MHISATYNEFYEIFVHIEVNTGASLTRVPGTHNVGEARRFLGEDRQPRSGYSNEAPEMYVTFVLCYEPWTFLKNACNDDYKTTSKLVIKNFLDEKMSLKKTLTEVDSNFSAASLQLAEPRSCNTFSLFLFFSFPIYPKPSQPYSLVQSAASQ